MSDTLPLLAFPETGGVKRIAVIQAYENFGAFIHGGSFVDRVAGLKRSLKTQFLSESGVRNTDLVVVNSHYMSWTVQSGFKTFQYESDLSAVVWVVRSAVRPISRPDSFHCRLYYA